MSANPSDDLQPAASNTPATPGPGKTYIASDLTGTEEALDNEALESAAAARANKPVANKPTTKAKADKRTPTKKTAKSSGKHSTLLAQPAQSIDAAIAAGAPLIQLDALLKAWSAFNEQQAVLKAKTETAALANSIGTRRRVIADKMLALADSLGIPVAEARKIFADAMEAQRSGKTK